MTGTPDPLDAALRARMRSAARALSYAPSLDEFHAAVARRQRRSRRLAMSFGLGAAAAAVVAGGVIAGSLAHSRAMGGAAAPIPATPAAPNNLYSRSQAALATAHALHIELTTQRAGSTLATAELTIDARGGFALDLAHAGGAMDSVRIVGNDLYLRGPDLIPASIAARVGGRWLEEPNGAITFRTLLESMYAPEHLAKCLMGTHGTLTDRGPSDVDGVPTERVSSSAPNPFTIEIARQGTPYPVSLVVSDAGATALPPDCGGVTGGPFGTVDLSGTENLRVFQVDQVPDVTPPASGVQLVASTPSAGA